jgi:pimeloyl-ACP methyl ester carboxylesterase
MSGYNVKNLEPSDFDALMYLEEEVFGAEGESTLGPYYVRLCCDFFGQNCFLCLHDDKPVGYLLSFVREREAYCTTLAVIPEFQGTRTVPLLLRAFVGSIADPVARERAILELTSSEHGHDLELARRYAALHDAQPIARANALRQMLAAARFRHGAVSSQVPVLMLSSVCDRMVDPICSRRIANAYGAELAVHPSAGHDLPLDDPRWCAEQIITWLAERG